MPDHCWNVLIVDDEESVHAVTKLALTDFEYEGKPLEYHHAYSGEEAREVLARVPDIAVILLDVVMETDDAGLRLCNYIRNELKNRKVRILLRTGNPGQAPPQQVIMDYEINDYIEKTELTMGRLINHMVVALRAYRDLNALHNTRTGYETMIDATDQIGDGAVPEGFVNGALIQLAGLLYLDQSSVQKPHTFALASASNQKISVIAITSHGDPGKEPSIPVDHFALLRAASEGDDSISRNDCYISRHEESPEEIYLLYLTTEGKPLGEADRDLVDLFCRKLSRFMKKQRSAAVN